MTTTKCPACQTQDKMDAGIEITDQERNRWMMWGCTCTAEDAAEAQAFMDRVTR